MKTLFTVLALAVMPLAAQANVGLSDLDCTGSVKGPGVKLTLKDDRLQAITQGELFSGQIKDNQLHLSIGEVELMIRDESPEMAEILEDLGEDPIQGVFAKYPLRALSRTEAVELELQWPNAHVVLSCKLIASSKRK